MTNNYNKSRSRRKSNNKSSRNSIKRFRVASRIRSKRKNYGIRKSHIRSSKKSFILNGKKVIGNHVLDQKERCMAKGY